jgi:hypothetical protein
LSIDAPSGEPTPPTRRFRKLGPVDYAFLIGGPIAFFLIAFFGLRAVVGPIPQSSAVQRIKDGEITPGMTTAQVLNKLGAPKNLETKADGSATIIYTRTVAEGDLVLEEGVVTVSPSGTVLETHVDRPAKPAASVPAPAAQ